MLKISNCVTHLFVRQQIAEDVGGLGGVASDAAEAPAAAATSATAAATDAVKDPQSVEPAPAEAESEDDSEDFALLGSLPTIQFTKIHPFISPSLPKNVFDYVWKTLSLKSPIRLD